MGQRNIYVARESRVVDFRGTRISITKGRTTAETDAPILDAYPDLFVPITAHHRAGRVTGDPVEQATSAPGEKRDAPPDIARKGAAKKATAKKATASKGDADDTRDDDADDGDDG